MAWSFFTFTKGRKFERLSGRSAKGRFHVAQLLQDLWHDIFCSLSRLDLIWPLHSYSGQTDRVRKGGGENTQTGENRHNIFEGDFS